MAVYIFCQVKRNELLRRGFILKRVWPIHSALFLALVPDALACPGHSDTSWALALIQHLNSSPTAIPKKDALVSSFAQDAFSVTAEKSGKTSETAEKQGCSETSKRIGDQLCVISRLKKVKEVTAKGHA